MIPAMTHFASTTKYEEKTLYSFAKMQYRMFGFQGKALMLLLGAALIAGGLLLGPRRVIAYLILFLGVLVISYLIFMPRLMTRSLVSMCEGTDHTNFYFEDDHVLVIQGDKKSETPYSAFTKLATDNKCVSLFLDKATAFSFQISSIEPQNFEEFKKFIESKTSKSFRTIRL